MQFFYEQRSLQPSSDPCCTHCVVPIAACFMLSPHTKQCNSVQDCALSLSAVSSRKQALDGHTLGHLFDVCLSPDLLRLSCMTQVWAKKQTQHWPVPAGSCKRSPVRQPAQRLEPAQLPELPPPLLRTRVALLMTRPRLLHLLRVPPGLQLGLPLLKAIKARMLRPCKGSCICIACMACIMPTWMALSTLAQCCNALNMLCSCSKITWAVQCLDCSIAVMGHSTCAVNRSQRDSIHGNTCTDAKL